MHHPSDRIGHTMAFVTQVVEHWLDLQTEKRHEIHSDSVRSWCDESSDQSFMVDPLRYFTTGVRKAVVCVILSVG